jgi:hypothetical protein
MASYFTGKYDVNRNSLAVTDDFAYIEKWYLSIVKLKLKGVVFHNHFSADTLNKYASPYVRFIQVDFPGILNANVYRYFAYLDYLKTEGQPIEELFVTDIADVEVVLNPFEHPFYVQHQNALFCGDEEEVVDNEWMRAHGSHLRSTLEGYVDFEEKNGKEVLLNCGVFGGRRQVMLEVLEALTKIHSTITIANQTPFTLDMGAFNFATRTMFAEKVQHGSPINTRFKKYESLRNDCWFRHK